MFFSIFDPSSHPIFGYNVKDVSVIYKKIHGSINYRLWHTSCHTITIHTWFCDFIRPKYGPRSCDNTRTRIYISAKKKIINYRWKYWTFTINYFLEHEWYLCPSLLLCTTFICDDYTTCLKIINCITQVMQVMIILGPCRNNWVTNFRQEWPSLLFFVHTQNANCSRQMQIAHSFLKNKIINKSDWCWQRWLCDWVTQLVKLQCFQGGVGHRCQIQV